MSVGPLDQREPKIAPTYDHYYVELESPTGPPKPRAKPQVVPRDGQANVFQDHEGRGWSSMFSSDHSAPWWERFGLIALRVEGGGDGFIHIDVEDQPSNEQKHIWGGGEIAEILTGPESL